jgi:nucleotide-binding universal stress UspA family protein
MPGILVGIDGSAHSQPALEWAAAEEILNAGADADMIVVGSRGSGGFARLLLGSVSSTVAEHAKVPVMILPAQPGSSKR